MKTLKRTLSVLLSMAAILNLTACQNGAVEENQSQKSLVARAETMTPMEFAAAMQPGWNLGNTLDASGGETSWGNPKTTPELIKKIKEEGFNSIRIPITWGHAMTKDNVIYADYLERTKEVISYALDADMLVMVNIHHDSYTLSSITPDENDEKYIMFKAIWEQLAEAYKDFPRAVMFESINEPSFDNESVYAECLDMMNKACVETVRASGGNNKDRLIVLPCKSTSAEQKYLDQLYGTMKDLNDKNLMATVHYYGFWPFSVNIAGETEFKGNTVTEIDDMIVKLRATFLDKEIPVVIGEWGLLGFDTTVEAVEHGEILKFWEYFCNAMRENDIPAMWWDNGQHFDRYNYVWRDPSLHAVIIQSLQGRSSTAERDFVNIFEGKAEEKRLKLSLNGNTFKGIRTEAGTLDEKNYVINGDFLTLTEEYTASLITEPSAYGCLETLYLEFSSGPDWKVYVYNTSTPELAEVDGWNINFTIPCDFKGTQVKTLEANYIGGGDNYPGGQNWTSFKQYGEQYTVDYQKGIGIRSGFFKESSKECEISITVYFWNDTRVEYKLTVSGDKVVGAPLTAAA